MARWTWLTDCFLYSDLVYLIVYVFAQCTQHPPQVILCTVIISVYTVYIASSNTLLTCFLELYWVFHDLYMLLNSPAHFTCHLSNNEFATKLAGLASNPNTHYYRHMFSNCQTIRLSTDQTTPVINCLPVLKTHRDFTFWIMRLLYSCPLSVEFSWT